MEKGWFNADAIQQRALLEAKRHFGGVKALARALHARESTVRNWLSQANALPYTSALHIEDKTHISIERLTPKEQQTNQILRRLRRHQPNVVNHGDQLQQPDKYAVIQQATTTPHLMQRAILINLSQEVILGRRRLQQQTLDKNTLLQTRIIDLEALWLGCFSLTEYIADLWVSERVAIGMALYCEYYHYWNAHSQNAPIDKQIARITNFSDQRHYEQARFIFQKANAQDLAQVDQNGLSIAKAYQRIKYRD